MRSREVHYDVHTEWCPDSCSLDLTEDELMELADDCDWIEDLRHRVLSLPCSNRPTNVEDWLIIYKEMRDERT